MRGKLDYRTMDDFVTALDNATLPELNRAAETAHQFANNFSVPASKRVIWAQVWDMIRKEAKDK